MLCPALLLALPLFADVHVDELHGFQIDVPEGWTKNERDSGEQTFSLTLLPPGSAGQIAFSVNFSSVPEGEGVDWMVAKAVEVFEASPEQYKERDEWKEQIAGGEAPGFRIVYDAGAAGEYRVEVSFVTADGRGYTVQRLAPLDEFDQHTDDFAKVAASFALVEPSDAARDEQRLIDLAARCGSEVRWAADWDEAEARAREEDRLVLVVAFMLPGFSMSSTPRNGLFMAEEIIELVNERFVPLWYTKGMDAPFVASYGLGGSSFGQALLLATPDGEVVLESHVVGDPDVAHAFLREGLARNPEFGGTPAGSGGTPPERAARHVARGELEAATELLANERSGTAHFLRARIHGIQRVGNLAMKEVQAARAAGGVSEAELSLAEGELWLRLEQGDGPHAMSRRMLDYVVSEYPDTDEASEARYILGILEMLVKDVEAAKERWRALADERPDSRWAWLAASALQSGMLDVGVVPDVGWTDESIVAEVLAFPERAMLPLSREAEAVEAGLAWLLAAQREDGSWISPTELSTSADMGPEPFVDAMTALSARALMRYGDVEGADDAVQSALAFLLASIRAREAKPPVVLYMDYMTWSDSMMLHVLAEAYEAELYDRDELRAAATALIADLSTRQVTDGGWSYYVTGDLAGAAAPAQSISFTTAAAVLALARAREVGFDVPGPVFDPAVSALEQMRDDGGVFAYFLYAGGQTSRGSAAAGAVGRGPACELALLRAGKSSPERVRGALDLFLEHAHLYSAEQGKVVMHAGPNAQGCHYLFFDYAHAALAQEVLPPDPKTRAKVLELVMDCRQPDGSFIDTPLMGRAYGTAMALLSFAALKEKQ